MPLAPNSNFVVLAKIGAAFGVKGEFRITTYTQTPKNLLRYKNLYLKLGGHWTPITFERLRLAHDTVYGKIKGCDAPESVRNLYVNKEIGIPQSELPPLKKNDYYWADLCGMTVVNTAGVHFGTVLGLSETPGAPDTLHLSSAELPAIPYVRDHIIVDINPDTRIITINWDLEPS